MSGQVVVVVLRLKTIFLWQKIARHDVYIGTRTPPNQHRHQPQSTHTGNTLTHSRSSVQSDQIRNDENSRSECERSAFAAETNRRIYNKRISDPAPAYPTAHQLSRQHEPKPEPPEQPPEPEPHSFSTLTTYCA